MSTDPNFANYPPTPAKSNSKIWVWLGLGCGAMLLLCCGGVGAVVFYFKNAVSADPVIIAQVAKEIADLETPADFQPRSSMNLTVAGVGMRIAIYAPPNNDGSLSLTDMPGQNADAQSLHAQMEAQIRQQLAMQGLQHQITVREPRTLDFEIRGKPANFIVQKGTDVQSNKDFIEAIGTFQGKQGPSMLLIQLPAETYNDEQVDQIIRSIK